MTTLPDPLAQLQAGSGLAPSIAYSALVLDQSSRQALIGLLANLPDTLTLADRAQWRTDADHVTLVVGPLPANSTLARLKGTQHAAQADAVGLNPAKTVLAVRVKGLTRPDGQQAHVTLAVKGTARPAESNDITNWEPLPAVISLRGTVEEVPSKLEATELTAGITHLSFLDFDGTLVDTPEQEEGMKAWSARYAQPYPYPGWWGREQSLDPAIWPMKRVYQGYQCYRQQRALPNAKLVLLTNRIEKLAGPVRQLLDKHGYRLDAYTFRQGSEDKAARVAHWLRALPAVTSVFVADDHEKYLTPIRALQTTFPHVHFELVLIDRTLTHPGAAAVPKPLREAIELVAGILQIP